jgi:hypothetical protein
MPPPSEPGEFYIAHAQEFCSAFASGATPSQLASFFRTDAVACEHGPDNVSNELPFLGRTYSGRASLQDYFEQVMELLKVVGKTEFSDWTVDTDAVPRSTVTGGGAAVVTTRGKATFEYKRTGKR